MLNDVNDSDNENFQMEAESTDHDGMQNPGHRTSLREFIMGFSSALRTRCSGTTPNPYAYGYDYFCVCHAWAVYNIVHVFLEVFFVIN